MRYSVILGQLVFSFLTLVQGQELMFYLDQVQIRKSEGKLENITCKNPTIFLMNNKYFELSETGRARDVVISRRKIVSFDIFDVPVVLENRLVIQGFNRNTDLLMTLYCTVSQRLSAGIDKMLRFHRAAEGINLAPRPNYKISTIWKYEQPGKNDKLIPLLGSSLLYIEDVYNAGADKIRRRRFIIRSERDSNTKWMVFCSDHFGVSFNTSTYRISLVIAENAGEADDKSLHYYAIDFSDNSRDNFINDIHRDVNAELNEALAAKIN